MNDTQTTATGQIVAENEFDFIDTLIVLAKRKKLVIGFPLFIAIGTALISLALPNSYKANIKILPPQQAQSGAAAVLSQLSGVAGAAAAGAAGIKNPNDLYVGMLKSRVIADKLIQRFNLKNVYEETLLEKTRKDLEDNTTIIAGKDNLISIDVEDHEPKRAADIANAYADELLKLTKTLAVTEAAQRRLFFERQLELTKDNLARSEAALKGALGSSGVISVDSDSRAMVETAAKLSAQIASKEIQLRAMQAFVTDNNQDFRRAQEELASGRAELAKLENGSPSGDAANRPGKQVGLENIKMLREVKYHQMLYELLAKQYEVARLDESKDSSIIQVLDKAMEPERKSKPKRLMIVLLATLISFMTALTLALFLESQEKALWRPGYKEKVNVLKALLKGK